MIPQNLFKNPKFNISKTPLTWTKLTYATKIFE